jgi:hypothetical protein
MYPEAFRLPQVSEHVLAWLERRRPGFGEWTDAVEVALRAEARLALDDVARRFAEVAVDETYGARLEHSVLTVALPRYVQLAREHHALQRRQYGLWRGGDLVSRAVYTLTGIVLAAVIAVTRVPKWLEPLPFAFILLGPFLPDLQQSFFERRYRRRLATLVADMHGEQHQLETYQPLTGPFASLPGPGPDSNPDSKEKT